MTTFSEDKETLALCALNRLFCYEPGAGLQLLGHFGTAAAVFAAEADEIRDLLRGKPQIQEDFARGDALEKAAQELSELPRYGACFIGKNHPGYPRLLLECPDHPLGLYIRSRTAPEDLFNRRRGVAFVGTRDLSPYGRTWCRNLVAALAQTRMAERPVVVSGLAFGIDGVAHETALEAGLPTIGVMATGIDSVYPTRHQHLAERMVETEGSALVSCYPIGTEPFASQFLSRNRIIAGISCATVLVESKVKGGGLITARHAFSYNRDVYALPGRVDDTRSQGCNLLLRNKTAEPVISEEDLLEKLGMRRRGKKDAAGMDALAAATALYGPDDRKCALLGLVKSEPGITVRELCARTGWALSEVIAETGILESDGLLSVDILQRCSLP